MVVSPARNSLRCIMTLLFSAMSVSLACNLLFEPAPVTWSSLSAILTTMPRQVRVEPLYEHNFTGSTEMGKMLLEQAAGTKIAILCGHRDRAAGRERLLQRYTG